MSRARRFDAANYLDTPQARAVYLQLAFDSGDAAEIVQALHAVARAVGLTEIARPPGGRRESLGKSLGTAGDPPLGGLLRVLEALGLRLDVVPLD